MKKPVTSKQIEECTLDELDIQDLKTYLKALRDFQKVIVDNSKSTEVAYCLLDAAFCEVALIENSIKNLGGTGFISIDDTADFIWKLTHKE